MADAAARKKAAEERRARILAKGSDRLNKITTSGRGEEAKLWDTTSPAERKAAPKAKAPAASVTDDPPDVDLSTLAPAGMPDTPLQRFMQDSSFADRFAGTEGTTTAATPNNMSDLFAQMMSGSGAAPGAPGQAGQPPPMLAQMLQTALGQQTQPQPQIVHNITWTDRLLPLVHIFTMIGIAVYAIFVLEPLKRSEQLNLQRAVDVFVDKGTQGLYESGPAAFSWSAWAKLGGEGSARGVGQRVYNSVMAGGLADVPLLYIFLVAELLLQSAQLLLTRNQLPPPSLFTTIQPYLPPRLSMYASTAFKYWALLGTLIDDFAVLVMSIAILVWLAEWRSGA